MAVRRNSKSERVPPEASASAKKSRTARTLKEADSMDAPMVEESPAASASNGRRPVPEEIDREAVANLAYSYWLKRGNQGGSPEEDWLRAEEELRERYSTAVGA
ncbi:MAG: DUF2934 domain-containing protein [Bryobacteraceae bacterium]